MDHNYGYFTHQSIQNVPTKVFKPLLYVRLQTSNVCVYGETVRFPLYVYIQIWIQAV